MTKDRILAEIRRMASENGGIPLGQRGFAKETGIEVSAWRGKYWARWSDAVVEAGFAPNAPNDPHSEEHLLASLVALTRRNKRFPTYADLRMARQHDDTFPTHQAFQKLGEKAERVALVRRFVREHPEEEDILELLPEDGDDSDVGDDDGGTTVEGAVYMLRHGPHYKIGKSFRVPQRHREIAIELPEKPDIIHTIATDDPTGIEAYWHKRFESKRTNGEWFRLTRDDIRAFKRRKFM